MITPGTRIAHYDVLATIGAGGMGEVYRAKDTLLGREVALKVLPEIFAADPDRRARFQREAKTLAALNHPNIAAIHGLAEAPNVSALVLELVDGETLADRIDRGPIPLDETLAIATQIAAALGAAHERGIVHRDLKPANVKLTHTGAVKVLDFGLAKLVEAGGNATAGLSAPPASQSPALVTEIGVPIGTTAYMSPEQVRGQAVDKRTDIWAFGCVLYEMLTATRAIDGDTVSDTLSNVLTRQPDLTRVPASVRPLLRSCLEQDARRRLRDIGDYWRLLEEPALVRPQRNHLPWATAAIAIVVAALALLWNWSRTPLPQEAPSAPAVRIALDLGPELSIATNFPVVTLSPDGERIVFVAENSASVTYLATKRLDQRVATPLPGTEGAYAPFFAPDGQWIGFFAEGQLKKTRLDGGAPIVLTRAPAGRGASWGDDGEIVAALDTQVGLSRVSSATGAVTPLTTLGAGETSHRWPQVLPGATAAVFTVGRSPGNYAAADIAAVPLGAAPGAVRIVRAGAGQSPHYLPTGHLVYVSDGLLYALPLDADRLETRGTPTVVPGEISAAVNFGSSQLSFSRTGAAVYRGGPTQGHTRLQWLTDDGQMAALWDEPGFYQNPRVSPDGGRLAVTVAEGANADLWVFDAERGTKTRLTNGGFNAFAVWHPDGRYIVFQWRNALYSVRADGADRPQPVLEGENSLTPTSFAPDGKRLLFFEQRPNSVALHTVAIEENAGRLQAGTRELFREIPVGQVAPTFSPDGRWIAYASSESGAYEIYVRAFPDDGRQWAVSSGGGNFPKWSRTANELFYRTEDQLLMATSYNIVNAAFVAARPRVWSQRRLFNSGLTQNFDLAPDGRRFAVQMSAEEPGSQEVHPVMLQVNFFDEVRRRVARDSE